MRFTLRDLLWVIVVIGALLGWWRERQKSMALQRERDEATANWHDASKKWLDVISLPPETWRTRRGGGMEGMGGAAAAPIVPPPPSDDSN
jgi:hypothetical protein